MQGVAVDPTGNIYVANGSGNNLLEFSPGGASLRNALTDQGDARNGYLQQVYEYEGRPVEVGPCNPSFHQLLTRK